MSDIVEITEAGVYDMPADVYHADPVPGGSLSASGAKKLITPNCPAVFQWERAHGQKNRRTFDYGTAAHMLVLGAGPTIHVVEADNYRTKAAQEERDDAYRDGLVPLLRHEYEQVVAMADALRAHPIASRLFARQRWEEGQLIPASGKPEQSLFWRDGVTGVWRRARLDWLPEHVPGTRMFLPDYKTCADASIEAIERAIYTYRYDMQGAWYRAGVRALDLAGTDPITFVLVCQEKTAPYLVTVVQLAESSLKYGGRRNRQALEMYKQCTASGMWPGYSDMHVPILELPAWAEKKEESETA